MGLASLAELDRWFLFARRTIDHGLLALVFIEGVEHAADRLGLIVEAIALAVTVRAVTVVHRAAEGRVRHRIAVAADGDVVALEHPGELAVAARVAEDVGAAA